MADIVIIGATGGVGSRLIPMLVRRGHSVTGLHRKDEQAGDLKDAGATPAKGDLMEMSADDFAAVIKGADAVVFSAGAAGSGAERTSMIDGQGPVKLIEAARATGVKRIYLVSVFPDAGRDRDIGEGFEHYMREKKQADAALTASGLDYVIIRPGTLKDGDGDGHVAAGRALTYGDVARGNVAAFIAELIDTPEIRQDIFELTDGDVPVDVAVSGLRRI
ncbi:SDR family oxidoreductase [Henriciella marina]|uniref:SDR family oxidoreductase n=1 Tax=Henriciella marina TaxID=453851 RepID=A0ABT4LVR5_9PROT|nr:SDR family oxidoreductase [Henriciella marina]MCZ4297254.1 SDR family oxidoreductase [Henriciella marina]